MEDLTRTTFLSSNSFEFPILRIVLPLKGKLTQSHGVCIFAAVSKSHLIINLTRSRDQRKGEGKKIASFRQAPCPISRASPHLKTPQNRYREPPQDPNIKQGSSLKVGADPARDACRDARQKQIHAACLLWPRLNYWQNGQTTQNCEQHILPMKIMIMFGIAHMFSTQPVSVFR